VPLTPLVQSGGSPSIVEGGAVVSSQVMPFPNGQSQVVTYSPQLDWWLSFGDEEIRVLVITRNLPALHSWQEKYGLMPSQADESAGGKLVESNVELLTGVQHRILTMPAWQVTKLGGVDGVMVVMQPPENPEPANWNPAFGTTESDQIPEPDTFAAVDLHGASTTWERNVTGSGVKVAIVDSGIDFAHPDLNGTQARVDDITSPWHGWPIMFDGRSLHRWLDSAQSYPSDGNSWFADTSTIDIDSDGDGLLDTSGLNITGLISQSGQWHIGEHPDNNLQSRVGDDVAVLVVDEAVNSSYDTVYVDLDGDGEFGDEVPMRKGSETAGLDLDGDGLWDRSGGLIYFIADGSTSLPYAPTYAARSAMSDRIPSNGNLVAFMLNENGGPAGSHGTLCASSVAAQGVIANAKVQGMAPNATLISVGNYYAGGSAFDGWRFVAEGYDGITDSGDEAQIGSFSFGYSGVVDAGSDQNSLYLDWLTRVYSKNTTFMVALGNGGHGYGTVASPGGAAGIVSVGAYSSKTGESAGATWGESISWSNRGPNSQGRMDPDLVAIGWSATGDVTLNEKTDANAAYRTWGGTSLATPVAAGLMALLYEAWHQRHGVYPDSQVIRNLAMSTAMDRANDPLVQGGGWFDAERSTATIFGENETWWTEPASWMPGENDGQHREANVNWLFAGDTAMLNLDLHNPSNDSYWVDMNATIWQPATHDVIVWESNDSGDWDGYQSSRPDIVIPLLIHGDANNTTISAASTLVRARATLDPRGFDGDQNYQSENRPKLRIYRWNDTDGDGIWWDDADGDGHVDSDEWESSNEYSTITEHMYTSPQVEVRIGDPWLQPGDGILLGIFRENVRTSQANPLPIEIDVTSFEKAHDSWISLPPQYFIAPNSTSHIPISFSVPQNTIAGLRMSTIEITDSFGHNWSFPIVATIAGNGPTKWEPPLIDGNVSNQSLYRETWMQGAQRWGWRAESGDWKAFAIDWPSQLTNGTIIVDVDWPDNGYTDIDAHWLSRIPHPYYQDDPLAYGQWGMAAESSSIGKHRGSGIWERQTATGSDRELLTAEATPGLKQLILHSTMHGVNTNDNPVNVSVGYAATISGNLSHLTDDWTQTNISDSLILGSTVDITPADISGWGWTQPQFFPGEMASQDDPDSVSSSSYIRQLSFQDVRRLKVEINTVNGADDLDLYLYRDTNGNGVIDWGSEKVSSSGNWNSAESIVHDSPADGTWWVVVHGYEIPSATTSFWLRLTEIGGLNLTIDGWNELDENQILALCPTGCPTLGGMMPKVAWRVNHTMGLPESAGIWSGYFELELPSGGGLTIPTSFELIEKPPVIEFRGQNDGVTSNTSMPLIAHVSDLQAGFSLSDVSLHSEIQIYADGDIEPINLTDLNPSVNATLLDGTHVDLTSEFLAWDDVKARENVTWRLPQSDSNLQHWLALNEPNNPTSSTIVDHRSELVGQLLGDINWYNDSERGFVLNYFGGPQSVGFDDANTAEIEGIQALNHRSTLTYWYRSASAGDDQSLNESGLFGYLDNSTSSNNIEWGSINQSGHIGIGKGNGPIARSSTVVADGTWHFIALTRAPSTGLLQVYVDGLLESQVNGENGSLSNNLSNMVCRSINYSVGSCLDDGNSHNSMIDDVRIYDAVLGSGEIATIYDNTRRNNISQPSNYELRSLEISLMIPDSNLRVGMYSLELAAGDLSGLEDKISILLGYDDDIPLYYTPYSNVFLTNQTSWHHTIIGESNLDLRINGIHVIQGDDASDMWIWPSQVSATTGRAVWYNLTRALSLEGENLFTVYAVDNAGNHRSSEIYVFRDTIAPLLSVNHTYPHELANVSFIDIEVETESGVELWVQGQSVFLPSFATNITIPIPLNEGNNLVNVTVRDAAGNWANANLSFTVDSIFPSLDWITPVDGEIVESHLVPLKWNLSETTIGYISVDGGNWISVPAQAGTSQWSVVLDLVGEHEFCLQFTDPSRNTIIECRTIRLNESTYTPLSQIDWDGGLTNQTTLYGNLWLGPSQNWELFSRWNDEWHKVHSGLSPNGGMHTIQYELQEGENLFRLSAGGLGIAKEWNYSVVLDTISPQLSISSPVDKGLWGHAGQDELGLRIVGNTEAGLFVQCWEIDAQMTTEGFADEGGNFSLSYTREYSSEVLNGQMISVTCSVADAAENSVSIISRTTFDGTSPLGNLSYVSSGLNLWVRMEATSPDGLQNWVLNIEHEGMLEQTITGQFNSTTMSFDEQLDLGIVDGGTWTARFRIWDEAGNVAEFNTTHTLIEESSPLDTFAGVNIGNLGMLFGVIILLSLLFFIDRRRGSDSTDEMDKTVAEMDWMSTPVQPTPLQAVLAAEAELELEAMNQPLLSSAEVTEMMQESVTISDLYQQDEVI